MTIDQQVALDEALNVDFAYLMWEDFLYQVEYKDTKKSNEMYYPRFTKVIINFFMTKDPLISRRNKVNWQYVRDDQMFTTIKLVSRHQNTQQFGAMLPVELTNKDIRNSAAYKEYYTIASGAPPPKTKAIGISHWGHKSQQLYGFAIKRESARDVYFKHDDKLYKFKEGNFKRHRIQDIKDMLLHLVQGKLTNLTVKECFAFNVSLRMFTRSIVIQRHVEDLQIGFESYQKKLNLTKPATYKADLKRNEAYTAYSNPRGFVYQNKDKQNRLMRIDELHRFSDGTHNDVRTALVDRLKGIWMKYLP
uniref:Uncharacterized protein n=1 Tax=Tanacetum cinerariifolium TaxID=118510 RepID=A0A699H0K1_TANCI|nr:hypothetical protein [Tanacetum cinerariifolium]